MKEYKIIPDVMMEEFQKVNQELKQNNYRDFFRNLTNKDEDFSYEDKSKRESEAARRIKDFYDSCQKLKNFKCDKVKKKDSR